MEQVELFTIIDSFVIKGRGVILVPDFSVPESGWLNRTENVRILIPQGNWLDFEAVFGVAHFNIADPDSTIDQRWRVTVRLEESSEKIPVGSKVFCSKELCRDLTGNI